MYRYDERVGTNNAGIIYSKVVIAIILTTHTIALQRTTSKLLQSYRILKYNLKDQARPRTGPQSESKAHSIHPNHTNDA